MADATPADATNGNGAVTTEPVAGGGPATRARVLGLLGNYTTAMRRGEIGLALAVIGILMALVLPIPPWLLDIALAMSLTLSVVVLMVTLFIARPLEFNAF